MYSDAIFLIENTLTLCFSAADAIYSNSIDLINDILGRTGLYYYDGYGEL